MSALPLPVATSRRLGLTACAEGLVAGFDLVALAGGEGARRLFTAAAGMAQEAGHSVETVVAGERAGALGLGAAAAGSRVALLASGPLWTSRITPTLRELARLGVGASVVVPAHGDETGEDLPPDDLRDACRLLDAPIALELAATPSHLSARVASMSLRAREMCAPLAMVFSLREVGLARADARDQRELAADDDAVRVRGDVDAPVAVVAAGERLAPVLARATAAGAGALRGVQVRRLRPGLLPALRRSLAGVREVTVIEALPGELGDDGLLTLLTSRALGGDATLRVFARGAAEGRAHYEDPAALDLELMPLELRRRLDLAGAHMSLAAWQAMELVSRAALCRFPVDEDDDLADFARAAMEAAAAVGHPLRERPALARPWDLPEAFAAVRARASSLGVPVEVVPWAALREPQRFALAHLAAPRRPDETFRAALLATGLAAP